MVNRLKADRLSLEMSTYMKFLHKEGNDSITTLWRKYGIPNNVSRATIHRHATAQIKPLNGVAKKGSGGRKEKLTDRHKRRLLRVFWQARNRNANFTSKKVQLDAGLSAVCSNRTVRRTLIANKLYYLQARKKGLLTKDDLKKRVKFARQLTNNNHNTLDYWSNTIAFYFHGTGFVHKTNPEDQAVAPMRRIWRRKGEGLQPGCTAKGSKAGYNGRVANFFVSISHGKGVISCVQYLDTLTGKMFSDFIKDKFTDIFDNSNNPASRIFLQDGDPRQNSKIARNTLDQMGMQCHSIPARSPDLNPIENVFHLVDNVLREEAIQKNIVSETFEAFSARVANSMLNFPSDVINRVIESMPNRINMVLKYKGQRLRY